MCWGWDFTPADGLDVWEVKQLQSATAQWRTTHRPLRRKWTMNSYRVLLTRARIGMVIWVPLGDPRDPSRPPRPMDRVYEVLVKSGARPLNMA
jgi:Schlafen group 3, DNA/RNA helicase domain